jgi:ferrochelatase
MLGERGRSIFRCCARVCRRLSRNAGRDRRQNREIFLEAGGEQYEYIPALNADAAHIEMMVNLTAPYR